MNTARKQRKEVARWEVSTRAWATGRGRDLALELYQQSHVAVTPYSVGLVLEQGEKPWVQVPACCSLDALVAVSPGPPKRGDPHVQPPVGDWLVTNHRIAGRCNGSLLRWWRWGEIVGCRVDLTLGRETVQIDLNGKPPILWTGPGVGPLAVAAVYHLYGPAAMLDHPGLAALRKASAPISKRVT